MMRPTHHRFTRRLATAIAACATALGGVTTAIVFAMALATFGSGCDKPKEADCKKAINNIRRIYETQGADFGVDPKAMVRSCRGSASSESVACFIKAKTLADLDGCEGEAFGQVFEGEDKPKFDKKSPPANEPTPPANKKPAPVGNTPAPATKPIGGETPTTPTGGETPTTPTGGETPTTPAGGETPTTPTGGETPAAPAAPAGGTKPAAPAGGTKPAAPAGGTKPAAPAGGTKPAAPTTGTKPATPPAPTTGTKPATPPSTGGQ